MSTKFSRRRALTKTPPYCHPPPPPLPPIFPPAHPFTLETTVTWTEEISGTPYAFDRTFKLRPTQRPIFTWGRSNYYTAGIWCHVAIRYFPPTRTAAVKIIFFYRNNWLATYGKDNITPSSSDPFKLYHFKPWHPHTPQLHVWITEPPWKA